MFWEDIDPYIPERLEKAVDKAYLTFERYRVNEIITYCACPVCMTREQAEQLSTLPLKEISSNLLAEYTNSAHGYDREKIEGDFKHFLPRYFDLIAMCDPPSFIDIETCLTRLNGYKQTWPENEIAVIDEFFDAFVEASVFQLKLLEWRVGLRLEYDMGAVLTMICLAGGDLERCLNSFEKADDPEAAVHMASLRGELINKKTNMIYNNAHLMEHSEKAKQIATWLIQPSITTRIMQAADLLNDPDYDDVLEMGLWEI